MYGVGSGVMIHDKLYRGAQGMGTEIGHISIRFDGHDGARGGRVPTANASGSTSMSRRVPALMDALMEFAGLPPEAAYMGQMFWTMERQGSGVGADAAAACRFSCSARKVSSNTSSL